jgi:hypothetical protein
MLTNIEIISAELADFSGGAKQSSIFSDNFKIRRG